MARFLGATQGNRGEATRLGSAASGIRAQAQGWDVGVKVYGNDDNGRDVFSVCATHGSRDSSSYGEIARVTRSESGELLARIPKYVVDAILYQPGSLHDEDGGVTITI